MKTKMNFKKIHEVDKESFAQLLYSAKGTQTMKNFALQCRVNPSTFTRIMKGLNKGASSPELLEAIADNAVPGSDVTLEKLANANGYVIDDYIEEPKLSDIRISKMSTLSHYCLHDHMVFSIICQELIERDNEITLISKKYSIGKNIMYKPDALIRIHSLKMDEEENAGLWCMEFLHGNFVCEKTFGRAFELFSRFAFIGEDGVDNYKPRHFSLVVTNPKTYDEIVDNFGNHLFSYDLRLILVDINNGCITNEFMFPSTDKRDRNYLLKKYDKK